MIPYTSEPNATIDRTAPGTSRGCSSGSREVGTNRPTATSATRMIGRFTRNTDPHQKCSSR